MSNESIDTNLSDESRENNISQKLWQSLFVVIIGGITLFAEAFQTLFSYAGAALITANVTTIAPDPGQQLILTLGMGFYHIIVEGSSFVVHTFIMGSCLAFICVIWSYEINEALKKFQTMKITFDKEKEDKKFSPPE